MEKSFVAVKGATLIDGTGAPPIKNAVIVVEGSEITAVGRERVVEIPRGAKVIDAEGKTIMPGMIDSHVHLWSVVQESVSRAIHPEKIPADASLAIMQTPKALLCYHKAKHALDMLLAGFTAVRDTTGIGELYENISLRRAIDMGLVPGPRIVAASWVEITGGHGDGIGNYMETWPEHKLGCADGPYEIRKKVREAARAGADQIKTGSSGHVWVGTGKTLLSQTKDEFAALVGETHMHGMKVMCHCSPTDPEPMLHAIEAGVDTIEHARGLTDDVIKALVKSKIIIVPTLSIYVRNYRDPTKLCSAEEREARERQHSELLARVKRAHQAGVKIAFGTDTYRVLRDYWTTAAYELQMYIEAGLKEIDAITFVTKNASEALGLEKKVGTIEVGKLADMIVVDGNPLDDIKILADNDKILYVIKNGDVVVDRVDEGGILFF